MKSRVSRPRKKKKQHDAQNVDLATVGSKRRPERGRKELTDHGVRAGLPCLGLPVARPRVNHWGMGDSGESIELRSRRGISRERKEEQENHGKISLLKKERKREEG